jgi:hypothetical protein
MKILILFLFCLLMLIVILARLSKYNLCANLIICWIFVPTLCFSCWFMAKTSIILTPYFVFGINRTLQEDIKVVKTHQRRIYFSNGESVYELDYFLVELYDMVSFLFIGGLTMVMLRYLALSLTHKISLQLYDCLLSKWPYGTTPHR